MKSLRYLAIALAIVAVLAITSWILRNSIVRQISSPILADYDIELVDVSLDALATSSASIGYLELVHAKGTTIVIEDLTLPISTGGNATKTYSAQRVSIVTTTRDDEAPFELALLINQVLSLSEPLAGNAVNIAEFNLPPYPSIRDLRWAISRDEQHVTWTVESIDMSVEAGRTDEDAYDVSFSLANQPGRDDTVSSISGKLHQHEKGISITGQSTLELSSWQAMAKLTGILPEAVGLRSGTGELQFEVEIPLDVSKSPVLNATMNPSSAWQISYADESGDSTNLQVAGGSTINIRATFPEVEWSLQQANLSLLVTNNAWRKLPLSVSNLACQTGPDCSMGVDIDWLDAELPIGNATKIAFSSTLEITFPAEGLLINVHPDASLELSGFTTPDNAIEQLDARLISAATLQYEDVDWRFSADSIDAAFESLALGADIALSSPLYLEKIEAGASKGITTASSGIFAPSFRLDLGSRSIATPGVRGKLSLQDSEVTFDLVTVDLLSDGTIKGQHNLDSSIGTAAILGAELSFDAASLSSRVAPWKNDFDISAGNLAVNLQANWAPSSSGFIFDAHSSVQINALAGFYADIAFVGASTTIELNYGTAGFEIAPTSVSIDLVDMGLPIENIVADVEIDINELAVDVDKLRMTAFSGVITAAPFSFRTARDVNNVTLTAKEIELAELLSIKEFAAVNVTGTVGAVLPITITENGILIDAGTLTGEKPGGVIRYLGGGDLDSADTSGLGLATTALSNFQYESLTADINYSEAGDLNLQMQIKGKNPELDDGRPVVLNLGVENNVPQMLKSLQAARAVEEILEKRLAD